MRDWTDQLRQHTRQALAGVAGRLARALRSTLPASAADLQAAIDFAQDLSRTQAPLSLDELPAAHPLARVRELIRRNVNTDANTDASTSTSTTTTTQAGDAHASPLTPAMQADLACDLLLLACLPEWHEGLATLCRLTHPLGQGQGPGQTWPTVTLALSWLEAEQPELRAEMRDAIEDILLRSPLVRMGLIQLQGEGPWHSRTLMPGAGLWQALMARAPEQATHPLIGGFEQVPGLAHWLSQPEVQQAVLALRRGTPCQILLIGGDAPMRQTRVRALLGAAQTTAVRHLCGDAAPWASALGLSWLYQACLWLEDRQDVPGADQGPAPLHALDMLPGGQGLDGISQPVIASAAQARPLPMLDLPQIRLAVHPLTAIARRELWQNLLPQLGPQANVLAARYPIEPDDARDVVRDLALHQELLGQSLHLDDIGACVRARTASIHRAGLDRVLPQADWDALLLPTSATEQLQSAVRRVLQQLTVLDDWGFAQGRRDRRGVRMLFYGPPGTGKTLAAEVMAKALGVDLLVVDLASLVSKWIGETEKNLAAVFDVAERSRALLLFDEADALFGKRTDTHDAQDRYANLETAYLLQRLERYEGVAVLTTNLRSQMDNAFSRRFEFIVEFPEPDARVRAALWRLHLPVQAPLADDVDLQELANWYALSGAQIKNAALAGAFLAASTDQLIHQRHFLWAIEREFDKAGRAHPGYPAHHQTPHLHQISPGGNP